MPMIDSDKLKPASDAAFAALIEWEDAGTALQAATDEGVGLEQAEARMKESATAFYNANAFALARLASEIEKAEGVPR